MPGGSSNTKTTNNNNTNTVNTGGWSPALPYLGGALGDASNAYNASTAGNAATLPSNFVAGLTPDQIANFQAMVGYGNNTAPATSEIGAGTGALNTGSSAVQDALRQLQGFNPAAYNNPGALTGAASQFVNGYNIPAEVQNAMQSAVETARDVTNPGIDTAAAGSGNVNSSRAGVAQGIVDRGLAEQAANLSGTLQNEAYGNSLNLASGNANNNISAALQAALGGGGLGSTTFGQGAGAISGGIGDLIQTLGLGATGGAGEQQGNQLDLENQIEKNAFATQNPFSSIDQYLPLLLGVSGTGQSGTVNNSGTSTETSTPSFLSTLGGILGAGGSLLGSGGTATAPGAGVLGLLNFFNKQS